MAKKKKGSGADEVSVRKKNRKVDGGVKNPFEVRFNHQKRIVLGRKTKNDRGMPGISRSKAQEKRKNTLLKEYQERFKANKFLDRRIGEYDATLSLEDKMTARFAAERKMSCKSTMYNLEAEEELTHYGQSLAKIEKFDDPRSDSDDEDDQRLNAEFVKNAHFGGGFLRKKEEDEGEQKSRQDLIDELIARTKEKRHEARVAKEETHELTEKLDGEWKDLMPLLVSSKKEETVDDKGEDYDRIVRELKFEARARPTDRLKTQEEAAKDNREALEELEADRLRRMKGLAAEDGQPGVERATADDLRSRHVRHVKGTDNILRYNERGELVAPVERGTSNKSGDEERVREIRLDLRKRKVAMDVARSEIPYVLKAPEDYDSFAEMVNGRPVSDRITIVDRMIKCAHPSLGEENKKKLETLFAILLQHVSELSREDPPALVAVDGLVPYVYDLAAFNPSSCARYIRAAVSGKLRDYAKTGTCPDLDTLVFLKLVASLYPTSDLRHLVATPSMLFMSLVLTRSPVETRQGIACGLFVSNLFLDYVRLSKRYVPEAVKFLTRVLLSNFSAKEREGMRLYVTGKIVATDSSHLDGAAGLEEEKISLRETWKDEPLTDSFKVSAVHAALELLVEFAVLYEALPSRDAIFHDARKMADNLLSRPNLVPRLKASYPSDSSRSGLECNLTLSRLKQESVQRLISRLNEERVLETPARERRRKPESEFKFHDPIFEEKFDGRKRRKGDRAANEKLNLVHKYKKEMKGAVREIRRDNQFLARHHLKESQQKDADRKRKLKQLCHDLANQESDCKNLKRMKSQKKK